MYNFSGKNKANWIALTSRSGKTLSVVIDQLSYCPSLILEAKTRKEHNELMAYLLDIFLDTNNYKQLPIITLNGYMWIIPEDICTMFEIYNLHPGPIHHPNCEWLKGKDPIERSFVPESYYPSTPYLSGGYLQGSVIHRVTPGVDEGEIIEAETFVAQDLTEAYEKSFQLNVNLWIRFFDYAIISGKIQLGDIVCE